MKTFNNSNLLDKRNKETYREKAFNILLLFLFFAIVIFAPFIDSIFNF